MRRAILVFCLLLAARTACAETDASLFFSPEETRAIEAEIRKNPPGDVRQAKHLVHLGSILYFGQDRWTVWLQGQRYSPDQQSEAVRILQVTSEAVTVSLALAGMQERRVVTLRPYQSFNLLTGEIVEGF